MPVSLLAGELGVDDLERGAEALFELSGAFVGQHLVLAGFCGVEDLVHQVRGIEFGAGGVRGHRGVDIADMDTDDLDPGGLQLQAQGIGR